MADRGFTLIEVIAVLIIAGILAALILPRFMGIGGYSANAAQGDVIAAAQYARQLALLGNGDIILSVQGSTVAVQNSVGQNLPVPGGKGYPITIPASAQASATFTFTSSTGSVANATQTSSITLADGGGADRVVCISPTGLAYAGPCA
ncbi:prepilin-type N-terminal cleavage/methylation domain-containing protein [Acidithiobacillus ferriphilus]|uniref:prepilin-type N-terminal cleavage/methylation domain-containing protein n=1 Tax=Acidithiobacillus ferriphilus TaxID=1689834 RepID=UPI001C069169|nr:prepilin-type N-terminal cleavage/methylation domain-containing protein [Acidithiobacillus ferriphilus]